MAPNPRWRVAGSITQQRQSLAEPIVDGVWIQDRAARGGELDGQKQTVESAADGLDRVRVCIGDQNGRLNRGSALNEQLHGVGQG